MKPSKQRKMLRAIQTDKARRRTDKQYIADKQQLVYSKYDPLKSVRRHLSQRDKDIARWI